MDHPGITTWIFIWGRNHISVHNVGIHVNIVRNHSLTLPAWSVTWSSIPKRNIIHVSCNYCEKSYGVPSKLLHQLHLHTGEKPYSCEHCGKSFAISLGLRRHMRIHTANKQYSCEQCGKSFATSSCLTMQTHAYPSEKKRHMCDYYEKLFASSSVLQCHMRMKTIPNCRN